MGVGGSAPRPCRFTPRERPGTPCTGGWVGPRTGLDGCGKSRPPPGFDPRTVQPVASRYTGWAIPAAPILISLLKTVRHWQHYAGGGRGEGGLNLSTHSLTALARSSQIIRHSTLGSFKCLFHSIIGGLVNNYPQYAVAFVFLLAALSFSRASLAVVFFLSQLCRFQVARSVPLSQP